MHEDLVSWLARESGLILVTGATGQGKTTSVEAALADPRCPPAVVFVGDVRGDVEDALHAVKLARTQVVVAVLRTHRAAGAFVRLTDMGVPAVDLADVVRVVFTTQLLRPAASEPVLLHEQLVVSDAIRQLIRAGAASDEVPQQAIADGMRSLY